MKVMAPFKAMELTKDNLPSFTLEESEIADGTTLAKDDSEHSLEGDEEEKHQIFYTAKQEDAAASTTFTE